MRLWVHRTSRAGVMLQALLIFIWLTVLSPLAVTDTYYSVYLLCGVVSLLCLWDNYRREARAGTGLGWPLLAAAGLFSLAVVLANYSQFLPATLESTFDVVCCFAGGVCAAHSVLLWMMTHLPIAVEGSGRQRPARVFFLTAAAISAVDLAYLFTTAYPGVLTQDSMASVREFMNGWYSNLNPFWFTVTVEFFYRVGFHLFGDPNAAIAVYVVFQILFLAACFGYAEVTLYQAGVSKVVLGLFFAVYAFLPHQIVYSVTVWKDVLFGAAALLMVTSLYRILRGIGKSAVLNYGIALVGILGFSLWRTNGWYAFAATVVVLPPCLGKRYKKLLVMMVSAAIVGWVMLHPVLGMLQVSGTPAVEAFSVPLQQLARVVYEGHDISQEEESLLAQALDLDTVREDYTPHLADPIKWGAFRRDNQEFVEEHFGEYVRLWLRLGVRYPTVYLKAWVELTRGYWDSGYRFWIYAQGVIENEFGIAHTGELSAVASAFRGYFTAFEGSRFCQPLCAIGLHVWLLIGCTIVNALKKRREEAVLAVPILVLVVGLWLGTPVYAEFRYAYPFFVTIPLLLGATCFQQEKRKGQNA